jgi:hypothetical protein
LNDMVDNDMNQDAGMNASTNATGDSPEEIKERVKQGVEKRVAAVAGALKGFTDQAEKEGLASATKEAIQKVGETTRAVAGTATKELRETKEHLRSQARGGMGGGSASGSVGTDVGSGGVSKPPTNMDRSSVADMPDLRGTKVAQTNEELEKE